MNGRDPYALDRAAVRRAFDAASSRYDRVAVLQAEVRKRLLERLDLVKLEPKVVVDLGCGTGEASRLLQKRYPGAMVIATDAALGMLNQARQHYGLLRKNFPRLCADAHRLPLADASADLIFSNLMLQWCDADAVFAEVRRILKPQGLFTFATFGPDTLIELRTAWSQADAYNHVNLFVDMHDLGDALTRNRFGEPVLDVERFTLTYDQVLTLMRELKAIGAHNVTRGRSTGLTGRRALTAMTRAYEQLRVEGKLPATYEVVYGHAWAPAGSAARSNGEAVIPLKTIGRRR